MYLLQGVWLHPSLIASSDDLRFCSLPCLLSRLTAASCTFHASGSKRTASSINIVEVSFTLPITKQNGTRTDSKRDASFVARSFNGTERELFIDVYCMWASLPDLLNLIFAVFNFANDHRLAKYVKLDPLRNVRCIYSIFHAIHFMCVYMYTCINLSITLLFDY